MIRLSLENKLVSVLLTVAFVAWGIFVAPFSWETDLIPRDPVPVDAIPDIRENQPIVYTRWMGKPPQNIEDQVTYHLTTNDNYERVKQEASDLQENLEES